LLTNKTFSVV